MTGQQQPEEDALEKYVRDNVSLILRAQVPLEGEEVLSQRVDFTDAFMRGAHEKEKVIAHAVEAAINNIIKRIKKPDIKFRIPQPTDYEIHCSVCKTAVFIRGNIEFCPSCHPGQLWYYLPKWFKDEITGGS